MELCKYRIGFFNCLSLDCESRSGGSPLLWKKEINLSMITLKFQFDVLIQDNVDHSKDLYLTGVFGHPDTTYRMQT